MTGVIKYIFILTAAAISGCGSPQNPEGVAYYRGIVEIGDSILFTDCATRISYALRPNEETIKLRDRSTDISRGPANVFTVEFYGDLPVDSPNPVHREWPRDKWSITVSEILTTYEDISCPDEFILPGLYEDTDRSVSTRRLYTIRPDYNFLVTEFHGDETQTEYSGIWYRTARLELRLSYRDGDLGDETFQILPSAQSITRTGRNKTGTYRKTYIR